MGYEFFPFVEDDEAEIVTALYEWWDLFSDDATCQTVEQDKAFERLCDLLGSMNPGYRSWLR